MPFYFHSFAIRGSDIRVTCIAYIAKPNPARKSFVITDEFDFSNSSLLRETSTPILFLIPLHHVLLCLSFLSVVWVRGKSISRHRSLLLTNRKFAKREEHMGGRRGAHRNDKLNETNTRYIAAAVVHTRQRRSTSYILSRWKLKIARKQAIPDTSELAQLRAIHLLAKPS